MPYPVQRYARVLNRFCVATKAFTKDEIEKILDLEDLQKFQKGAVGAGTGKGQVNKKTRDSEVMWIMHDQTSDWLYQKFSSLVSAVNYEYTVYKSKDKQHYDWHVDASNLSTPFERKISATIVLTDPSKYEGGEFECVLNGRVDEPFLAKPELGDVIFFDSKMPHRVRPVTSGIRKSLVAWVMGKNTW
jgi:predicted 2-oxoglutarate/Fe(II)-dependent dioxygenase YbiX